MDDSVTDKNDSTGMIESVRELVPELPYLRELREMLDSARLSDQSMNDLMAFMDACHIDVPRDNSEMSPSMLTAKVRECNHLHLGVMDWLTCVHGCVANLKMLSRRLETVIGIAERRLMRRDSDVVSCSTITAKKSCASDKLSPYIEFSLDVSDYLDRVVAYRQMLKDKKEYIQQLRVVLREQKRFLLDPAADGVGGGYHPDIQDNITRL